MSSPKKSGATTEKAQGDGKKITTRRTKSTTGKQQDTLKEKIAKMKRGEVLTTKRAMIYEGLEILRRFRLDQEGTSELIIRDVKYKGKSREFKSTKTTTVKCVVLALLKELEGNLPAIEEEILAFEV